MGSYQGRVDREEFDLLAAFVTRSGFFAGKDEYLSSGTDLPAYTLEVVRGSETKRVAWGYSPGPPDFHVIARLVDAEVVLGSFLVAGG